MERRHAEQLATLEEQILALVEQHWQISDAAKQKPSAKIHYAGRVYDAAEVKAGVRNMLQFYLTYGAEGVAFEQEFAALVGARASYVVNSGSSANLVAVTALCSPKLGDKRLLPGDEVIVPAASFPTTVAPLVQNGLTPVFIDVELGTYNPSIEQFVAAYGPKTRAIMFAHTLGNPADIASIATFCREHNLYLIEDCCDALGSSFQGKNLGTFGDLATCSFYPAHHITMGEGGAVMVNNVKFLRIVDSIRSWGKDCWCKPGEKSQLGACNNRFSFRFGALPEGYDHKYTYTHIGYNLKPLDIQCAIGREQLKKFPHFKQLRKDNFAFIHAALAPYEHALILPRSIEGADPCWFAFPITVRSDAPFSRSDLVHYLEGCDIETRPLFAGNIVRQPAFQEVRSRIVGDLRNADTIMHNTFFIGVYPGLEADHLRRIQKAFNDFFTQNMPTVPPSGMAQTCCRSESLCTTS